MKLSEEPRLPGNTSLVQRLTDILRPMLRQLNAVTTRTDTPITAPSAVTVGASPFVATAASDGVMTVTGGTVSLIEYGRQGAYTTLGITAGLIPIKQGDTVRVTYTVSPNMVFVPQ